MPARDPNSQEPESSDTMQWSTLGKGERARDLSNTTLGDFQILRLLGRGGMGEVYLARQTSLHREVALKVLRPELLKNVGRLREEALAAGKLNDTNIVHIYDFREIDGIGFIAMEYVQGTNLKEYLTKKGPPELMLALSIMRQAGSAVKAAGEMGLVHRDIKPENLLLTKKGVVKVADFGLCRDLDRAEQRTEITHEGVTLGTPLYMSPEQAQGHSLDHRSDLYSLGITFYHMLAGEPPFQAPNPVAVALKQVKETPVDLSVHCPKDQYRDICRLVMKLIEKDPGDRYQSASEMLRDLSKIRESIVSSSTTEAVPLPAGLLGSSAAIATNGKSTGLSLDQTVAGRSTGSSMATTQAEPTVQPRSLTGLLAATMFVALLGGAATGYFLRSPDLLAANAKAPATQPGLWMSPGWRDVTKQASPEKQYRYAQIQAPSTEREAAWLAVPGHFPQAKEWTSRAYTQLTRVLFREREAARLKSLARELERLDRGHEKRLAEIAEVAGRTLDQDPEGVIGLFTPAFTISMTDPGLAELSLEVTLDVIRTTSQNPVAAKPATMQKLKQIEQRLIVKTIELTMTDTLGRVSQPSPESTN
jgi:serine/threonine-protein kinase